MVAKIPPPPPVANIDPALNRWLIELQNILNASGAIQATAVTQPPGTNNTTIATTAFVLANTPATPSNVNPNMDGVASPGSAATFSRGDHVHPSDTSRAAVSGQTFTGQVESSSPSAGVGYATGAGGTVTQSGSKSASVTLNKASGAITMNNAALAASTAVSFTLTDSSINATDTLVLNHITGGTVGSYMLNAQCAAGSALITVRNVSLGSLSEAIVIQFAILRAVNA